MANDTNRDLVLAPGEFAYILDTTKGQVQVNSGPFKTSMAGTDQPVIFNTERMKFDRIDVLDKAIQRDFVAPEGFYLALYNPAKTEKDAHPPSGKSSVSVDLNVGHRLNIPGPATFALWPGQFADIIRGHHIRSNQYLLAQVYNDTEATSNWPQAVVKTISETPVTAPSRVFAPGQLMVIKGTEVAFFIPPTGVKVVPESDGKTFVRDAVTLERLEYCILLDEDGNKRFVQGPAVVFPEPTENFVEMDGVRKFKAIELNETTGIYVKVIANYVEGDKEYKAGDELFITGKEQAIYYQREEHSVIRYGDRTKHYAVAVPAGEGRYVLNRLTGNVKLVRGPIMLLCDPRSEVIVRRVLAQSTAQLWYPNNQRVLAVNKELEAAETISAMSGAQVAQEASYALRSSSLMAMNYADEVATQKSRQIVGDTFQRGTSFSPPRTITLDTKYEGAVSLSVWNGYAVLIIPKVGTRKVAIGPENILLEYDETLAPLELSTGKPKTDDKLFKTVYLRVRNNRVSDIIVVETSDFVKLTLSLAYRVNFEGEDQEKWFAVENYIRLLTDHLRSMIRNVVKRLDVQAFYANPIDIIRDAVLGPVVGDHRAGRLFEENAMRVYDLEVLDVTIQTPKVAELLQQAQIQAIQTAVTLSNEERALVYTQKSVALKVEGAKATAESATAVSVEVLKQIEAEKTTSLSRIAADEAAVTKRLTEKADQQDVEKRISDAVIARTATAANEDIRVREALIAADMKRVIGESEEIVKRAAAVQPQLVQALSAFADQALIEKMTVALAPMAAMSGTSVANVLSELFKNTPFEGVMKALGERSRMPQLVGKG